MSTSCLKCNATYELSTITFISCDVTFHVCFQWCDRMFHLKQGQNDAISGALILQLNNYCPLSQGDNFFMFSWNSQIDNNLLFIWLIKLKVEIVKIYRSDFVPNYLTCTADTEQFIECWSCREDCFYFICHSYSNFYVFHPFPTVGSCCENFADFWQHCAWFNDRDKSAQ